MRSANADEQSMVTRHFSAHLPAASRGLRGHPWWWLLLVAVGCLWLGELSALAARIGEDFEVTVGGQLLRFLTLRDPAVRHALLGAAMLGVAGGVLGSFLVVRKLAMVGDTLSHAVLPGVAAGFLWSETKDPLAVGIGAVAAGLLGAWVVQAVVRTTRLKEDTALGLVLAGFYAVGICLVTMIQRLPTGNKSGLDKFMFGQAAAIGPEDLQWIAGVTGVVVVGIGITYRVWLVSSFDPAFAQSCGFPVRRLEQGLLLLLAFTVVSALQAVGVVLVSALLIIPAAAAYLLTDRLHRMLVWAGALGLVAGVVGCLLSFLGPQLPTGPLIVLTAAGLFGAAFLLAPRHGLLVRVGQRRARQRRFAWENSLKAVYHVLEHQGFRGDGITLLELAERRRETLEDAARQARDLAGQGWVRLMDDRQRMVLTPEGRRRAEELVRNHRLWELYLTHAAEYPSDHVHEDAEKIEHVLGEDVVRQLEERLGYAHTDPHGRPIPVPASFLSPVDPPSTKGNP